MRDRSKHVSLLLLPDLLLERLTQETDAAMTHVDDLLEQS
jgi:hypothetical protein